jgi:hypothetical protein
MWFITVFHALENLQSDEIQVSFLCTCLLHMQQLVRGWGVVEEHLPGEWNSNLSATKTEASIQKRNDLLGVKLSFFHEWCVGVACLPRSRKGWLESLNCNMNCGFWVYSLVSRQGSHLKILSQLFWFHCSITWGITHRMKVLPASLTNVSSSLLRPLLEMGAKLEMK